MTIQANSRDAVFPPSRIGQTATWVDVIPGLLLVGAISAVAFLVRDLSSVIPLSPILVALVGGIVLRALVGLPAWAKPGAALAMRPLLRLAVALLGVQLTVAQVLAVGSSGLITIIAAVAGTFVFTIWAARLIGVDRRLAELLAAGTSICGASAIVAANTVTRAPEEDVAYAIASITLFGSLAIVVYPIVAPLIGLDAHAYGLWTGASIHEVAQVVAAAFQGGPGAGETGSVVKLTRVLLLAPMVLALALSVRQRTHTPADATTPRIPTPWFVLGFAAFVLVNSAVAIPPEAKAWIASATQFLLAMALAAIGLEITVGRLRTRGLRPLVLGFASTLFISLLTLGLIELLV